MFKNIAVLNLWSNIYDYMSENMSHTYLISNLIEKCLNLNLLCFLFASEKKSGHLSLVCELMEMNIYEVIRGKFRYFLLPS